MALSPHCVDPVRLPELHQCGSVGVEALPAGAVYKHYRLALVVKQNVNFFLRVALDLENDGRLVLIKFFLSQTMFSREARSLVALSHPNIVKMLALFAEPLRPFHVTEVWASTLEAFGSRRRPWDKACLQSVISDTLAGLRALKDHGLVYCNVRPSSLGYFPESSTSPGTGCWKLIDFTYCTAKNAILSSPISSYASPEEALGYINHSPVRANTAIDIFALGRTILWMTGFTHMLFLHSIDIRDLFFPALPPYATEDAMMQYLAASDEELFRVDDIADACMGRVVQATMNRTPGVRADYDTILAILQGEYFPDVNNAPEVQETDQMETEWLFKGRIISGVYQLDSCLGRGRFGIVWKATDIDSCTQVALKCSVDTDVFLREVDMLRAVSSLPNIVTMADVFEKEDTPGALPYNVLVTSLGEISLHEHAKSHRPLRISKVKDILQDIVTGLEACHAEGIVHADLKPQNIVLFRGIDNDDQWKLLDFDSSCYIGEPVNRGTFEYCAPEVLAAYRAQQVPLASPAIDLFALGRILQWMTSYEGIFWVGIDELASDAEKEILLLGPDELAIDEYDLPHAATRNLVRQLIEKKPAARMSSFALQNSSYLKMNLDTSFLAAAENHCRFPHPVDEDMLPSPLPPMPHWSPLPRPCTFGTRPPPLNLSYSACQAPSMPLVKEPFVCRPQTAPAERAVMSKPSPSTGLRAKVKHAFVSFFRG